MKTLLVSFVTLTLALVMVTKANPIKTIVRTFGVQEDNPNVRVFSTYPTPKPLKVQQSKENELEKGETVEEKLSKVKNFDTRDKDSSQSENNVENALKNDEKALEDNIKMVNNDESSGSPDTTNIEVESETEMTLLGELINDIPAPGHSENPLSVDANNEVNSDQMSIDEASSKLATMKADEEEIPSDANRELSFPETTTLVIEEEEKEEEIVPSRTEFGSEAAVQMAPKSEEIMIVAMMPKKDENEMRVSEARGKSADRVSLAAEHRAKSRQRDLIYDVATVILTANKQAKSAIFAVPEIVKNVEVETTPLESDQEETVPEIGKVAFSPQTFGFGGIPLESVADQDVMEIKEEVPVVDEKIEVNMDEVSSEMEGAAAVASEILPEASQPILVENILSNEESLLPIAGADQSISVIDVEVEDETPAVLVLEENEGISEDTEVFAAPVMEAEMTAIENEPIIPQGEISTVEIEAIIPMMDEVNNDQDSLVVIGENDDAVVLSMDVVQMPEMQLDMIEKEISTQLEQQEFNANPVVEETNGVNLIADRTGDGILMDEKIDHVTMQDVNVESSNLPKELEGGEENLSHHLQSDGEMEDHTQTEDIVLIPENVAHIEEMEQGINDEEGHDANVQQEIAEEITTIVPSPESEPEPEPEQEPEPEPKSEQESEQEPKSEQESEQEPKSEPEPEAKSEPEPEPEPEVEQTTAATEEKSELVEIVTEGMEKMVEEPSIETTTQATDMTTEEVMTVVTTEQEQIMSNDLQGLTENDLSINQTI